MQSLRTTDGFDVAYRVHGAGGDVAVLVHGWMAAGSVWDDLLPELPGMRLVVPELRGVPASPAPAETLTLARLADDIVALLERLDAPVHLVGHSMGGQVAAWAAGAAPARVRSLALLTPVPPDGLALPDDAAAAFRSAGGDRAALGGILDSCCVALAPEARAALVDAAARIAPETIAAGLDAWTRGGVPDASLAAIVCPTVVVGTDDPFLPKALLDGRVVRRIRGARLATLGRAGHYPQLESPRATAATLRELWSTIR